MTNTNELNTPRTLDEQRREFAQRRGLAMPLAGAVAWTIVGAAGVFLRPILEVWVLFGAVGSILYLGIIFSRFTGENLSDRQRPKNVFDGLFLRTVGEAVLVFAIAIPFFRVDYTSLPLSVGILSGLMWLPFSWIIEHWIGTFHTLARTVLVTASWYLFPNFRFIAVPAVIVAIYAVTIVVLEGRWRGIHRA
jgi:ethanolamine transporter EutH